MRCATKDITNAGPNALSDMEGYGNLAFTQFRSPLFETYAAGKLSGRQLLYFHAACRFTHYFEYKKNEDLIDLYAAFKDNPMLLDRVSSLDKSLGTYLHTLGELCVGGASFCGRACTQRLSFFFFSVFVVRVFLAACFFLLSFLVPLEPPCLLRAGVHTVVHACSHACLRACLHSVFHPCLRVHACLLCFALQQ